jgi:selenocysteine lyase/cysteine desulfurase
MIDHQASAWVEPNAYRLRDDARRFETWENAYALRLGLGAAVEYALAIGMAAIQERCFALARRLRAALVTLPDISVYDLGRDPCAIVTFAHRGVDSFEIKRRLAKKQINVSVSRPGSTLLDALARNLPRLVRASPHYYNTEAEVDALVEAVNETV